MRALLTFGMICVGGIVIPIQESAGGGGPEGPLLGFPTCVEIARADIRRSEKRRAEYSNCDPSTAHLTAFFHAERNASNALAATCIARTTPNIAARTCEAVGSQVAPGGGIGNVTPTAGATQPYAAIDIGVNRAGQLCTVLRHVPNETETSTSEATDKNGWCIWNNFRVTNVTARARATCGVGCEE